RRVAAGLDEPPDQLGGRRDDGQPVGDAAGVQPLDRLQEVRLTGHAAIVRQNRRAPGRATIAASAARGGRAMATARGGKSGSAAGRPIREIHRRWKAGGTPPGRFLYCGNDGVIRGKACHTRFLDSYLTSGIGVTVAMQSFNMLDQLAPEGAFGPVGEFRLMPDPETFAVLPYAPKSARLLCDMVTLEGEP